VQITHKRTVASFSSADTLTTITICTNCGCQLTQVNLDNGHKMVVNVCVVYIELCVMSCSVFNSWVMGKM